MKNYQKIPEEAYLVGARRAGWLKLLSGGPQALFGDNIGQDTGYGWVYYGDTNPGTTPITGPNGQVVYLRPQKTIDRLDPGSQTLTTCQHWEGTPSGSWGSFMPHVRGSSSVI